MSQGAFQYPPFQTNAFQTAFSFDAFQRCAFQYPGFQTHPCPKPPPVQDGRSGYWRLFFTQMQEDSLKADEEVAKQEKEKAAPVETIKLVKKAKKIIRRERKQQEAVKPTPLRIDPVNVQPTSYDVLANLPVLVFNEFSLSIYQQAAKVIDIASERKKRARLRRRQVAALLLMAA